MSERKPSPASREGSSSPPAAASTAAAPAAAPAAAAAAAPAGGASTPGKVASPQAPAAASAAAAASEGAEKLTPSLSGRLSKSHAGSSSSSSSSSSGHEGGFSSSKVRSMTSGQFMRYRQQSSAGFLLPSNFFQSRAEIRTWGEEDLTDPSIQPYDEESKKSRASPVLFIHLCLAMLRVYVVMY
ncbi:uncharacterized protein EMH_0003780 [Eimeria mitis]|uniref:Uncharacterized protein n=1 Tax=Eimeria mitis TaxID=44415 RepID=U6JZB9_9EIME|nr:uncharacterized protein EMH_0003780 [Eimeria mitis]CDJ29387.1 hypothetical protein, conserved [Eimeria mitis]